MFAFRHTAFLTVIVWLVTCVWQLLVHMVVFPFSQHQCRWVTELFRPTGENVLKMCVENMCVCLKRAAIPSLMRRSHCCFCLSLRVQVTVHHGQNLPSYLLLRFCGCVYVKVFARVCAREPPVSAKLPGDSGARCGRPDPPLRRGCCLCSAVCMQQLATYSHRLNRM